MLKPISKVYLVDDDEAMNFVNDFFLKHYNFCQNVVIEKFPEDALKSLKTWYQNGIELPQLILLDMNMPVMNGLEFALKLGETLPDSILNDIDVYVLSSSDISSEMKQIETLPYVKGHIPKPIQMEDLQRIFEGRKI